MPYTISHTAAVLPFSRHLARYRVLSAAVIGSMVPDFGYLLPWRFARFQTHSAIALATFCLPVGLATYWFFQFLLKRALLELLPDGAYLRSRPSAGAANIASLAAWLTAAAGLLVGAVTHLVWDAFTHENARGVRMIPALDDTVADIAGHHLLAYKLMQQGSSVAGLAIAAWIVWAFAARSGGATGRPARDRPQRATAVAPGLRAGGAARRRRRARDPSGSRWIRHQPRSRPISGSPSCAGWRSRWSRSPYAWTSACARGAKGCPYRFASVRSAPMTIRRT